jgi:hypothetical protein
MDNPSTTDDTLLGLIQIEPVGDSPPFRIVLVAHQHGAIMSAEELMAAKVMWAARAGYCVLTQTVPTEFLPYNTVIRVSENGTEDRNRDYLAHIAFWKHETVAG